MSISRCYRKLNILHIITKLELGGAQKSTLDILRYLNSSKYRLFLATSAEGALVDEASKLSNVQLHLIPSLRRQIDPFNDLKALIELYKYIRKERIDIVHTHSSKAGILGRWAARLAAVPIIIHTIHGWEFHRWQGWFRRRFYTLLERITARITDRLIAVSNHDIRKGQKAGIGTDSKYTLIRYGIQIEEFANSDTDITRLKDAWGLDSNAVVGMVACFKPQKAPEEFIRASSIVKEVFPQTKFLLVGDGILRPKLERLIDKLNLEDNVVLTGWRQDVSCIMALVDIFVLSSLWEGSPLVFLEAMACGKPVVATDVDGNKELIKDGINGFLVKPRDSEGLARRIICLLRDNSLAERMGKKSKEALDYSFTIEKMVERIDCLYEDLRKERGLC